MKRVRAWMYRNARPLELALYRLEFEGGSRDDVLRALSAYQNPDGGFAHALEADVWNDESSPIQTWAATEILLRLGLTDAAHPMVQGLLAYLMSGRSFKNGRYLAAIPSNNQCPHAPWWTYNENEREWGDNPTAALAAFMLRCEPENAFARDLLHGARERYMASEKAPGFDTFHCMRRMGQALPDDRELQARLTRDAQSVLTKDENAWRTTYSCRPSDLIDSEDSLLIDSIRSYIMREIALIKNSRGEDGVWNITWNWNAYEREFAVAENWWKAHIALKYLRFLALFHETLSEDA